MFGEGFFCLILAGDRVNCVRDTEKGQSPLANVVNVL